MASCRHQHLEKKRCEEKSLYCSFCKMLKCVAKVNMENLNVCVIKLDRDFFLN